jgi:hypothetical protein
VTVQTYFEDMRLDAVHETPAITVTQAHASLFQGLVGEAPAPGGLVPELLPLCLTTGLGWRVARPPLAVQAFVGFEWEIVRALRVGDTIRVASRTRSRRAMREAGIVVEEQQIIDQHGEVVQRGRFTFLVAKRPTEGVPP